MTRTVIQTNPPTTATMAAISSAMPGPASLHASRSPKITPMGVLTSRMGRAMRTSIGYFPRRFQPDGGIASKNIWIRWSRLLRSAQVTCSRRQSILSSSVGS